MNVTTSTAPTSIVVGHVSTLSSANSGHTFWSVVVALVAVAAAVPAGLRWLRVAQREHYLPDSCSRFAVRWWTTPANAVLLVVVVAGLALTGKWPAAGLPVAVAVAVGPLGLTIRGRTWPLAWTRRLRTLAVVWAILQVVVIGVGVAFGVVATFAVAGAVAVPCMVDLACLLTAPWERRGAARFVTSAKRRLAEVAPRVVAVTGSFGKTSTKGHIVHLLTETLVVVASPASYNNRAGLSRAVNEHLAAGTEVFVAEMGTYGRGEIAELCSWCPPDIAVITAIGPVHLERFGTEDRIVSAKAEITQRAAHVVLNVDNARLAALADRLAAAGKDVRRCSAVDPSADVMVRLGAPGVMVRSEASGSLDVAVDGAEVARGVSVRAGSQPGNLACALAVALLCGVPVDDALARLATLPEVPNRLSVTTSPNGFAIIDDTYNANPAGARAALAALAAAAGASGRADGSEPSGRRVVVTPGMVELGSRQRRENRSFAAAAARVATDLVVVGRTNRKALLAGAGAGAGSGTRTGARDSGDVSSPETDDDVSSQETDDAVPSAPGPGVGRARSRGMATVTVATRPDAVAWVRDHLGPGDVVLYENDLPDQYP